MHSILHTAATVRAECYYAFLNTITFLHANEEASLLVTLPLYQIQWHSFTVLWELNFTSCPIYSMQQPVHSSADRLCCRRSHECCLSWALKFPATPHMQKTYRLEISISSPKPCFKAVRVSFISSKQSSQQIASISHAHIQEKHT